MLQKIRTYRTLPRFLAITLFMTTVWSLAGHVCMMEAHADPAVDACCCSPVEAGMADRHETSSSRQNAHQHGDAADHHGHHPNQTPPKSDCAHDATAQLDAHGKDVNSNDALRKKDIHRLTLSDNCCAADFQVLSVDATARTRATLENLAPVAGPVSVQVAQPLPAKRIILSPADPDPPRPVAPPFHILYSQFLN